MRFEALEQTLRLLWESELTACFEMLLTGNASTFVAGHRFNSLGTGSLVKKRKKGEANKRKKLKN